MKMVSKKSKWFVIFAIPAIAVAVTAVFVAPHIQSPAHIGNNSNITHDGNRNQSISYTQTQIIAQKSKYFYVLTYHTPSAYYSEYEEAYEYAKEHGPGNDFS